MSSKSRQQVVVEAIRQWQTRLLQLDRRNALLYFSMGKRGVMLRDRDPDALLERLAWISTEGNSANAGACF